MWEVITEGLVKIMMVNANQAVQRPYALEYVEKPRHLWSKEDRTRNNLDNITKDILFKTVDDTFFPKI